MGRPLVAGPETWAGGGTWQNATYDDYNYQYQWTKTWQGQGDGAVSSSASNHVTGLKNGSESGWWTHTVPEGSGNGSSSSTSWGSLWDHSSDTTVSYPGFWEARYYGRDYGGSGEEDYIAYLGDAFNDGSSSGSTGGMFPFAYGDEELLFGQAQSVGGNHQATTGAGSLAPRVASFTTTLEDGSDSNQVAVASQGDSRDLSEDEKKILRFFFLSALNTQDRWVRDALSKLRVSLDEIIKDTLDAVTLWNFHGTPRPPMPAAEYQIAKNAIDRQGMAAVTLGTDIYFSGKDYPQPGQPLQATIPLIAHEVFHALQVQMSGVGRRAWIASYGIESGIQKILGGNVYEGNLYEVYAYAMDYTVRDMFKKYGARLWNVILSGTADEKDQLREEIRTTFMKHVNTLELRYRKSRWNLLPRWLR